MKWLKDILTDNDGDFDIVSICAAASLAVFLGLQIYSVVWQDKDLNGVNYGAAVGALIASLGGAYHFKANKGQKQEQADR